MSTWEILPVITDRIPFAVNAAKLLQEDQVIIQD
jgi:hypothetical protein